MVPLTVADSPSFKPLPQTPQTLLTPLRAALAKAKLKRQHQQHQFLDQPQSTTDKSIPPLISDQVNRPSESEPKSTLSKKTIAGMQGGTSVIPVKPDVTSQACDSDSVEAPAGTVQTTNTNVNLSSESLSDISNAWRSNEGSSGSQSDTASCHTVNQTRVLYAWTATDHPQQPQIAPSEIIPGYKGFIADASSNSSLFHELSPNSALQG